MSGKKTNVMLSRGWPGQFTRTMRDENGAVIKDKDGNDRVLRFQPGQVVELAADELEAVRDDVGVSLHFARIEKDAKPVPSPDHKATTAFVAETKALREEQRAERAKAKEQAVAAEAAAPAKPAAKAAKGDLEKKDK